MENINPRKVLTHLFSSFLDYPPDKLKIIVSTNTPLVYDILPVNGKYRVTRITIGDDRDIEENLGEISNAKQFFDLIGNEKIVIIQLENFGRRPVSMVIFKCEHNGCRDLRIGALTADMRESRLYAQVTGHPELLRQEGYFKQNSSFGKKRKAPKRKTTKIPANIKKLCRRFKIKMTVKRGSKRVYKSLRVLKRLIKNKKSKVTPKRTVTKRKTTKRTVKRIKHPKKYYANLNLSKLRSLGIKKSDPKFFIKVNNLSKKMVGKSGKYVNYKGEYIPVEGWCREYGNQFYDKECKRDLKDAGITVYNYKPGFGKRN